MPIFCPILRSGDASCNILSGSFSCFIGVVTGVVGCEDELVLFGVFDSLVCLFTGDGRIIFLGDCFVSAAEGSFLIL